MSREIVFIIEPDAGRVTVETSRVGIKLAKEIERDLGQGTVLNCARPLSEKGKSAADNSTESGCETDDERIHLFRLYHRRGRGARDGRNIARRTETGERNRA